MTRPHRLLVVLGLNLALVAGLAAVGLSAHSLGVLAAALDYLADAAAIGVVLVALRLSSRGTSRHPRANVAAAAINAGWLLVLSALVVVGAARRLVGGTPAVHALPVVVMSGVAALAMAAGAAVLRVGADDEELDGDAALSLRAVLLDTAADAASAAGVALSGGLILATGSLDWLDPIAALVIALAVATQAARLLRQVAGRLRPPAPPRSPAATRSPPGTSEIP